MQAVCMKAVTRDEHGSGLDRTGSGLKPIVAGSGLDQTEKMCCFDVIILTTSKMLLVM